jgi:hypothetical protein
MTGIKHSVDDADYIPAPPLSLSRSVLVRIVRSLVILFLIDIMFHWYWFVYRIVIILTASSD